MSNQTLTGAISREQATAMVQAYDPMGNTRCVWFSIEEISAILRKMNSPAALTAGVDGLRIYFAKYTEETAPANRQEYIGRNTLILVSTIAENGAHQDYFPDTLSTECDDPGDGGVLTNHGELCPERCDGTKL